MNRIAFHIVTLVLAISIAVGSLVAGFRRTEHALANSGLTQIVICSGNGTRTVTVDAEGNAVTKSTSQTCAHCADCSLVPPTVLADLGGMPGPVAQGTSDFTLLASTWARAFRAGHAPRGPPPPSKV